MKPPTASQKRRMDEIAQMGCLVCGARATIHHVTASIHSEQHCLGEKTFAERHQIDLHALAKAFCDASPKRFEIIQQKLDREAA